MMRIFLIFTFIFCTLCSLNAQHAAYVPALPARTGQNAVCLLPDGTPHSQKSYTGLGWVTSDAYMKYLLPSSYNLLSKLTSMDIFPDSCLKYVWDKPADIEEFSVWRHAIGNSFDPYSESYDKMCMTGLFPTPSWPEHIKTFGYRIDTLKIIGAYHWGEEDGYNPESPDTLRVYLAYYRVYEKVGISTEWYALHYTSDIHRDTALFSPMVRVDTAKVKQPCGSAITPATDHYITLDYLLGASDTTLCWWDSITSGGDTVRHIPSKAYTIPTTLNGMTEEGFIVPAGAVISCIVKFIPGYAYRQGDTLAYGRITASDKYMATYPRYRHNCFSVMVYSDSNQKAYCDPYGFNFNFYEHKYTRYQMWTSGGKPNTLYNSMYDPSAQILPLIAYHISVDSSSISDSLGMSATSSVIESIYPNPANSMVTVALKNDRPATIRIYNVMGQEVKRVYANEQKTTISIKDLSAGMYIISVEQNGKRFNSKLTVQ